MGFWSTSFLSTVSILLNSSVELICSNSTENKMDSIVKEA